MFLWWYNLCVFSCNKGTLLSTFFFHQLMMILYDNCHTTIYTYTLWKRWWKQQVALAISSKIYENCRFSKISHRKIMRDCELLPQMWTSPFPLISSLYCTFQSCSHSIPRQLLKWDFFIVFIASPENDFFLLLQELHRRRRRWGRKNLITIKIKLNFPSFFLIRVSKRSLAQTVGENFYLLFYLSFT